MFVTALSSGDFGLALLECGVVIERIPQGRRKRLEPQKIWSDMMFKVGRSAFRFAKGGC